jgi:hypothetical protein
VHPQSVRIWDVWLHERAPASPHFPDFLVCLSRRLSAKIGTTSCRWDDDSSGSIHIDPPVGCRSRCRCTSVLSLSLSKIDLQLAERLGVVSCLLLVKASQQDYEESNKNFERTTNKKSPCFQEPSDGSLLPVVGYSLLQHRTQQVHHWPKMIQNATQTTVFEYNNRNDDVDCRRHRLLWRM